MNLSAPFVRRPIATVLLTAGVALAGIGAFFSLPVAPLPQVDYPTISVNASLSGASPATMATSVATPLERRLGAISDVNEITSQSSSGTTRINLQFALTRNIDSAAREVQAAINAARVDLPATLRSNPTYNKSNPSQAPVMVLALTSDTMATGKMYEAVTNVLQQKLAQVPGVGEVEIGGGSLPGVRIDVIPFSLNRYGLSLEDVRAALESANANRPKGAVGDDERRWQLYTNVLGRDADDYRRLIVSWKNGAAIRLGDVAEIRDGPADEKNIGLFNGEPAVVVLIRTQPGANVIQTVDRLRAILPQLQAQLPPAVRLQVASDRTRSIRTSLHDVEFTLVLSIILVVLVVSAFLRNLRATIIPAVATIVSLLGTFGVMQLMGFSLNNLSLMALTVATGFVVDDAIVVLENTSRHLQAGMSRVQAALQGAREVGFTVVSMSLSLVAVFIPLLFMAGQQGRLFLEFALTLSAAVMISLVVSLTTTPMLCAQILRREEPGGPRPGRIARFFEAGYEFLLRSYEKSLDWALGARGLVMALLAFVVALNAYLLINIPKGFFPQQDTGSLMAGFRTDQSISFQALSEKLQAIVTIVRADPAVSTVVGFAGGSRAGGFMFVELKPLAERKEPGSAAIARLRPKLSQISGVSVFLNPVQDLRMGGRSSNATYQYTLKGDNGGELKQWAQKLSSRLEQETGLTDISTDQQENGVETFVTIDRDTASRFGITPRDVDNALYNAFGQRTASTIYEDINQYSVVLAVARRFREGPDALNDVYVPAGSASTGGTTSGDAAASGDAATRTDSTGSPASVANPALRDPSTGSALATSTRNMVPLAALTTITERAAATSISHQDATLATTVSFNLAEGTSLSDARGIVRQAEADIGMPTSIGGSFEGLAKTFEESQKQQPLLILAAIVVVYILLGVLYESYAHPVTVLSTLPSAGVGAVLALMLLKMEFSLIALIGLFLLIGIVKKNAILIIDFALDAERSRGLSAVEAVREASLLRFRPILMTTLAAALGALPLALGYGEGSELRQPLGVTIIGGLIASQLLTLLTTPVVYVYMDKLRRKNPDERLLARHAEATA
ncbi:multidrug efflux pump [Panacagrimonas perspica]|uniref:Multidrug efflux pump n=1 Tax=Panacagrimonas perspica TaxID=381431 RepID=A0A4R7NRX6_9GAMM|nr:efflux RND transporter permease subunit [Panacagrimonas perspica]TDU23321.1 multidrug efflux pump [Panacagrimonas perspica]THD00692.1 nodulation protein [Panacagrimonas perspica]